MLVSVDNVSLAYGLEPLLDHVKFQIEENERVCLIGRNGAGKSSLLKIIDGTLQPDSGNVWRKPTLRYAQLKQELPRNILQTVYEYVAAGLAETGKLIAEYHALIQKISHAHTDQDLQKLESLQRKIDTNDGWRYEHHINTILQKLDLDPEIPVAKLSGGWQRRAALAQALVTYPELLLLDEPTNHLDIEAIQWLENWLLSSNIALLFITHDRQLLKRLATRIIELDRGQLSSWPGNYVAYLRHKEELLQAEEKHFADFDKKLAQEERWIRQGIKARRTRNEGRVRALISMRRERAQRRTVQPKANFVLNEAAESGQLVVEATHISYKVNNKTLIKDFSIRIMRGDKIALIGPNGAGKTTLLNILLGKQEPTKGNIKIGTKLQVAYFDQLQAQLNLEKTVMENVVEGTDTVEINGKSKHVMSYLNDFLFTPQRARTPVKALSGGERNRLLLAKLFAQPSNLLVMDEPTNDLDIETLELLEELLNEYQGTLLLVSHDRAFIDNVVTSVLIFEGEGHIQEYTGGYLDFQQQRAETSQTANKEKVPQKVLEPKSSQKLSYKEQRELDELPKKIESLESEIAQLHAEISSAEFYKKEKIVVTNTLERLKNSEQALSKAYSRWEELESK